MLFGLFDIYGQIHGVKGDGHFHKRGFVTRDGRRALFQKPPGSVAHAKTFWFDFCHTLPAQNRLLYGRRNTFL